MVSPSVFIVSDKCLTPQTCEEFKLFTISDNSANPPLYPILERFHDCVCIPVFDILGNYVATIARYMYNARRKYDMTSFNKSRNLFNLNMAWPHIMEKGFAVVVEGPFDAIGLWQGGVKNVVCSFGNMLSDVQVNMLLMFTRNIVMMYDGDDAGRNAMMNIYFKYKGLADMSFVWLPDNWDPDTFILKQGKEELNKYIRTYEDLLLEQAKKQTIQDKSSCYVEVR